ncbi:MAG: hypothetical protein M3P10_00600 [Actinomycetota bacterium]|nr:hypothetical protein [Actinomycetota bacterium]
MRRKVVPFFAVLVVTLIGALAPAQAGPAVPFQAHPRGHSYQEWMRLVGQFFLGDASNPLIAGLDGDCGELIDGVFFMAAPIDVGVEFECEVPVGTPIVLSHAGFFTTEGIDGNTDADLLAAAEAGFTYTSNSLSVDGKAIRLRTISAGVFDVISEPGSFYDTIAGVGTGPVRTALIGNVVFLHPLSPGDHTIETEVTFTGSGGAFSATYHVHVS